MGKSLTWDLDEVLTELKFGKHQILNLLLIGALLMFTNFFPLSFSLTAKDPEYRCKIPDCEGRNTTDWLKYAIPLDAEGNPKRCERFVKIGSECAENSFSNSTAEFCSEWVFTSEENTVVKEFGKMCENGKESQTLATVGFVNNVGQFFGTPLFGIIADRYGRRFIAISCTLLSTIFGVFRALSTSYVAFAIFEFLDAFFGSGIYGAAFTLGIELVNPKMRPLAATIIGTFYPLGAVVMGLIAWWLRDWRKLLLSCYVPGFFFLSYFWLIAESIRWLQVNGRTDEMIKTLQTISKWNKTPLSADAVDYMRREVKFEASNKISADNFWTPLLVSFQSRKMVLRVLNCSFAWFSNIFVYYGLTINAVKLAGNEYTNFILVNLVEVPAFILSGFIMNKIERRTSQSTAFILSGVCCVILEFVPTRMPWLKLIIYLGSKFLITISFNVIYIFSVEMFPTELRSSLCGVCSMFGRLGSIIAPLTLLLRNAVAPSAPVILFGAISLVAGALALFLPETLNKKLPDTVHEAKCVE